MKISGERKAVCQSRQPELDIKKAHETKVSKRERQTNHLEKELDGELFELLKKYHKATQNRRSPSSGISLKVLLAMVIMKRLEIWPTCRF